MKIDLVHDYLYTKGGAERTVLTMAKALKPDIFTVNYSPKGTFKEFSRFNITSKRIENTKFPFFQNSLIKHYRNIDLSKYDVIISSGNWAKQIGINPKNHPQIHYEYTPPRVLYDLYESIKVRLSFIEKQAFRTWVWYTRRLDIEATKKVEKYITISKNVKKRAEKFYKLKKIEVIYPPTKIEKFVFRRSKGFFLSVQRFEPEKRIELQIEAFRKMPEKTLILVGSKSPNSIEYFDNMKRSIPKNVKILENISDKKLIYLYSICKATIQTSLDEDFGLIPVESMAAGKPCIAVNEGGFKETIVNRETGLLLNNPYEETIRKAVENFDNINFDKNTCMKRAKFFSEESFISNIKKIIKNIQ